MLQMFDDGRLTDGQGRLIDFKNTVLIMTSNLASDVILDENLSSEEKQDGIQSVLKSKFKPEFLNRIDEIIMFKALTLEELSQIVEIQTNSLKKGFLNKILNLISLQMQKNTLQMKVMNLYTVQDRYDVLSDSL